MFDRLEDLLIRFEEIMSELNEPFVVNDQTRFQKLMKEQSDLQPIVDAYKEYKESKQTVEDSLSMLEEESDEEMREMLKEELNDAKKISKNWNISSKFCCFRKIRTMRRTLSSRYVPEQAGMRRLYLQLRFTACM